MSEKPAYAPGCFGKIYCYAEDAVCGACEFAALCKPARDRAFEQRQAMYGIKAPTRQRVGLPVKVQQVFDSLGRNEEEVRNAFLEGQNPYRISDGPVGIVAHLLLSFGEVKRAKLIEAVGTHRQLNDETAAVYTRYAIQILTHCGAITVEGDRVKAVRG